MWESRSDFQERWNEKGNLFLVLLAFLCPSFPQPLIFTPTSLLETDWRTEFACPGAPVLRLLCRSPRMPFSSAIAGSVQPSNSGPRWVFPVHFPGRLIESIDTPLFALGTAYDKPSVQERQWDKVRVFAIWNRMNPSPCHSVCSRFRA